MNDDTEDSWGLVLPFWTDTDGYTARDREMFVCGVEFQMIYASIKRGKGWNQYIHSENVSRVRMMCKRLGVKYALGRSNVEGWWQLAIARDQSV